jgi:glycosyltransferase involved in cell wall biosynthesis
LHVLNLGKYFPPVAGGIENFLRDLVLGQAALDARVSVLVHDAPRLRGVSPPPERPVAGVAVTRVRTYGQWLYAPLSPGFGRHLARALRDGPPDLLHVHLPNTSAFWLLGPGLRWLPLVLHWHADVAGPGMDRRLALAYAGYRPFEQALLRRARAVIATSAAYAGSSLALAPWQDKVRIIPLGLAADRLAAPVPGAGPDWRQPGALRVLALGRLARYKGFAQLIRAVAATPGTELVIVGDGEERAALEALIRVPEVAARVQLAGHVPEARRNHWLAGCDLLCLPSLNRAEAFGLVLLEAMAFARPALVSAVPGAGMTTVVQDGITGWQVPAGDAAALARRLAWLAAHREAVAAAGAAAAERFRSTYAIGPVARQTLALYREVLGREVPGRA